MTRSEQTYGINPQRGAVVVLRPDGYVSLLSELEDTSLVSDFFSAVLKPADQHAVQSQTRAGSGSGATTARDTGFNGSKAQSETPTPQVVGDAAIQGAGAA